ncbi:early nodulin-75-like [Cephus cinctus]|uniref:Early nodulin-75-like n=1 Tax=Cephus cinctus TaxID=211228 RepID=A0AAJ7BSV0_CEPCN|nr:early nodulin-75-like [Cephus cinctus]
MPIMSMPMEKQSMMMAEGTVPRETKTTVDNQISPCPPFYPNFGLYLPPPSFSRPYGPPTYPKKEIAVSVADIATQVQFVHRPSAMAIMPKQTISYVKPVHSAVSFQTVQQSIVHRIPQIHPIHPTYPIIKQPTYAVPEYMPPKVIFEKPKISYIPLHTKPIIQPITYTKTIAKPISFSAMNFKKYEYPIVYQKPTISFNPVPACEHSPPPPPPPVIVPGPQHISYNPVHPIVPAKLIHVPPPISYVKVAQPIFHAVQPIYSAHAHSAVPVPAPAPAPTPVTKASEIITHPCTK